MRADCHMHMILDGVEWRSAIARHSAGPDEMWIRQILSPYQELGFTYLRDGGDRWGAGAKARQLAPEYGIVYRTPLAPLCKKGHYGAFIGRTYETMGEFRDLVADTRKMGGDFIKIMISGLMDFDRFGVLTDEGRSREEIREVIHIAHEEGLSVMVHANGADTAEYNALMMIALTFSGLVMLYRVCQPFNIVRAILFIVIAFLCGLVLSVPYLGEIVFNGWTALDFSLAQVLLIVIVVQMSFPVSGFLIRFFDMLNPAED